MQDQRKYCPADEGPDVADELAWRRFCEGDQSAFELIFKKYNPVLIHFGVKFFHDRDVVKDCIQELFLQLWNRRETLPDVKAVKYYLITSLRRLLLRNVILVKKEADFNNSLVSDETYVLSHESKLIHQLSTKEWSDQLTLAIEQLPPRQKEAVYLKFYEERSYEEITSIMSINYQTARKFIYKALQVIRKRFADDHGLGR